MEFDSDIDYVEFREPTQEERLLFEEAFDYTDFDFENGYHDKFCCSERRVAVVTFKRIYFYNKSIYKYAYIYEQCKDNETKLPKKLPCDTKIYSVGKKGQKILLLEEKTDKYRRYKLVPLLEERSGIEEEFKDHGERSAVLAIYSIICLIIFILLFLIRRVNF